MNFLEAIFFMACGGVMASLAWASVWRARSDEMRRDVHDQVSIMRKEVGTDLDNLRRSVNAIHDFLSRKGGA